MTMAYNSHPSTQLHAARCHRLPIAADYARWLSRQHWDVALTLNFGPDISRQAAVQAARIYWQRMDVEIFGGNAVQRRGIRLGRACFLEGETGVRNWHYHAAVQLPPLDACRCNAAIAGSAERFGDALLHRWSGMREAGRYSKAEPIYGAAGWVTYISKDVGKGECELCTATSYITGNSDTM